MENDHNFWINNVAKSINEKDIDPSAWNRICKMRNSPIKLLKDVILGETHKPYTVIPRGLKGYIIDYPEAFNLSWNELETLSYGDHVDRLPALFFGYEGIVFLKDDDYEIIPPFFDMGIANFAADHLVEGGS